MAITSHKYVLRTMQKGNDATWTLQFIQEDTTYT